jgi:hypothetical protein
MLEKRKLEADIDCLKNIEFRHQELDAGNRD